METVDEEIHAAQAQFVAKAAKDGKPFFVWLNTTRMHVWTHLTKAQEGVTGIGLYPDGMVAHDKMIGEVLKQLDELGIADNTIVVYGTDNGAEEPCTWPDGGTTPFHGEKGHHLGGRLPRADARALAWRTIKPGTLVNDIFSQEDWMPTLLAAAGEPDIVAKLKQGYKANGKSFKVHLDGYNFLPYFKGEVKKGPREEIYYFGADGDLNAMRWNDWKVHFAVTHGNIATAVRSAGLAGNHQPPGRSLRAGIKPIGDVHPLVCRQHLAVHPGAAKAQGVSHHAAGIPLPAGQQPERRGHQLQLPAGACRP